MKKYLFVGFMLMLSVSATWAQSNSHSEKLPWVIGEFPAQKGNFEYKVGSGEGHSLTEARNNAMNDILVEVGNLNGIKVSGSTAQEIISKESFDGNKSNYYESNTTVHRFQIDGQTFVLSMQKADEYYEYNNGKYQVWQLYEVNVKGESFKPVIVQTTDKYGFKAGWRSMLVPGWGQFYKRKVGKGVFFLTTEIAAASGIVVCEIMRSNNVRKSKETTNIKIVKEYRKRADNWELGRNITIGALAGVYLWNVLDAALAKGKIHYAWIPENLHLTGYAYQGTYYTGFSINF